MDLIGSLRTHTLLRHDPTECGEDQWGTEPKFYGLFDHITGFSAHGDGVHAQHSMVSDGKLIAEVRGDLHACPAVSTLVIQQIHLHSEWIVVEPILSTDNHGETRMASTI